MTRRIGPLTAAGLPVLLVLGASSAHGARNPAPALKVVAAEVSGATGSSHHLNVAVTGSCAPDQADTEGLVVTTDRPGATAGDLLECTDQAVTQIVALTSTKGSYRTGTAVKITAVLRTSAGRVLVTDARTVNVQ